MEQPLEILSFLERAAAIYPERVGFVDEPNLGKDSLGELTYQEIRQKVNQMAASFDSMGLVAGDRIAIISKNSARTFLSFFATSGYGKVLVPINFRLKPEEIAYIVQHSGAKLLLADPDLKETVAPLPVRTIFLDKVGDQDLFAQGAPKEWKSDESAVASINYTSGTTAMPKGVVLTHRNLWLNSMGFCAHFGLSDRDVYLHTLPMFHCNGWGMPYAITGMGGRHICLSKVDGHEIIKRIENHGITILCGAPIVMKMVLDAAKTWSGPIPGYQKIRVLVAGAPPPTKTIEEVETVLGWEFIQIYGLTETSPMLTVNRTREEWDHLSPNERARRLSRAGVPAMGAKIKTSDSGEVLAQGNMVMREYWNDQDNTSKTIKDHWFHTGDGGELGDDGYLTITDRKKDIIITGGENVSSLEVEDVLFMHPAVKEVAVVGAFDDAWGERVLALVVKESGTSISEAELIEYARSKLAHYKCPKNIEFRDNLERTATGKLQKYKLRAPYLIQSQQNSEPAESIP